MKLTRNIQLMTKPVVMLCTNKHLTHNNKESARCNNVNTIVQKKNKLFDVNVDKRNGRLFQIQRRNNRTPGEDINNRKMRI